MSIDYFPGLIESPLESKRFGLSVGRLTIQEDAIVNGNSLVSAIEQSPFDVIIARYPNRCAEITLYLSDLQKHRAIYADTLLYWESRLSDRSNSLILQGKRQVCHVGTDTATALVRPIFESYTSHYSVNPLFAKTAVLDGYVEWVTTLLDEGNASCLALRDTNDQIEAFAIVDFGAPTPDVKFGGVHPSHRERGAYGDLIRAVMADVGSQGYERLMISTQSHNTPVMSVWARLGWFPIRAETTLHLVNKLLLSR